MKKTFVWTVLILFSINSVLFGGTSIKFQTGLPANVCEWSKNSVTVEVKNTGGQGWTSATLNVTVIYHATGTPVTMRTYNTTGITGPGNSSVNIQLSYFCSDVQLAAVLTTDAPSTINAAPISTIVYAATPVYTGGPFGSFGSAVHSICRWTKEPIQVTLCDGLPADESDLPNHIISNYGQDINPDDGTIIKTYNYNITSTGGFAFENLGGNPISAVQFSSGSASFQIKTTAVPSTASISFTNQDYTESGWISPSITIQNPQAVWKNITNLSTQSAYTNAIVHLTNNISSAAFTGFPSSFNLNPNPGTLSASLLGFTGSGVDRSSRISLLENSPLTGAYLTLADADGLTIGVSSLFNVDSPNIPANCHLVTRQVLIDNMTDFSELTFVGRVIGPRDDYKIIVNNNTPIDKGEMTNRFFLYAITNTTLTAKGIDNFTYGLSQVNIIDPGPYYIGNTSALTNDRIVFHIQGYSGPTVLLKVKSRTLSFKDGIPTIATNY